MTAERVTLTRESAALVRAGLVRAEQGLSGLLSEPMAIRVDLMTLEPVLSLGRLITDPETAVVGVYVSFGGDLTGHCLLCLDGASGEQMAVRMLGCAGSDQAMLDSALLEAGNIVVSGLVNGLADHGGWTIQVSPPCLARDMLGALVHTVLAAASINTPAVLAVQARFQSADAEVRGTLLILPDAVSLQRLTGAGRRLT